MNHPFITGLVPYVEGQSARRAPLGSVDDELLAESLKRYRREVAKRYRVIDPSQVERIFAGEPLFISTKLDGELWFLVKRAGAVALVAYNGRALDLGPAS
jgi:hypothetical protein